MKEKVMKFMDKIIYIKQRMYGRLIQKQMRIDILTQVWTRTLKVLDF